MKRKILKSDDYSIFLALEQDQIPFAKTVGNKF